MIKDGVKALKRKNKTKQIKKEEKEKEQRKAKARRGRPIKNVGNGKNESEIHQQDLSFSIESEFNSTDLIKNFFLDYMNQVGYGKGLVFTEQARAKLRTEQSQKHVEFQILWDPSHQWKRAQQISKAKPNVIAVFEAGLIKQEFINQAIDVFLEIGDIFPREITGQIYRILQNLSILSAKIELKCKAKELSQIVQDYVEEVCTNPSYYFLNGKFSKIFPPEKNIEKPLTTLFKEITKKLKQIYKEDGTIKIE